MHAHQVIWIRLPQILPERCELARKTVTLFFSEDQGPLLDPLSCRETQARRLPATWHRCFRKSETPIQTPGAAGACFAFGTSSSLPQDLKAPDAPKLPTFGQEGTAGDCRTACSLPLSFRTVSQCCRSCSTSGENENCMRVGFGVGAWLQA